MKIVSVIARYLLGLMFVVFGLNGFLHFIPQPPLPAGLASQFLGALAQSNYFAFIFACQLIGGVLLLANRFVPIGLVLLAPVIVNVLLFHALMAPSNFAPGLLAAILWGFVFSSVRSAFRPIFSAQVQE